MVLVISCVDIYADNLPPKYHNTLTGPAKQSGIDLREVEESPEAKTKRGIRGRKSKLCPLEIQGDQHLRLDGCQLGQGR